MMQKGHENEQMTRNRIKNGKFICICVKKAVSLHKITLF